MEDFYYTAIYHALQSSPTRGNLAIAIRRLKAKILRLQSKNMRGVPMDTDDNDAAPDEDITTYHYIGHESAQKHECFRTNSTVKDNSKLTTNL